LQEKKSVLDKEMWVLFFFTTSVRKSIRSGKYLASYARDARRNTCLHVPFCGLILAKIGMHRQILAKLPNIQFHNSSSGSLIVTAGAQTGRWTYIQ
jgi:hypothetical protein